MLKRDVVMLRKADTIIAFEPLKEGIWISGFDRALYTRNMDTGTMPMLRATSAIPLYSLTRRSAGGGAGLFASRLCARVVSIRCEDRRRLQDCSF